MINLYHQAYRAAVGGEVTLGTEHAPFRVPTVVADEPVRVEVTFQPDRAHAVIEELDDRDIKPGAVISLPAR